MRIAIIGGGLAGTACAYMLKQAGLDPVIYEASQSLASGASGNTAGLYNPRFGAEFSPESQYYAQGFEWALEQFSQFEAIDWNPCGALHLVTDEKKETRFRKMLKSWPWDERLMRWVFAEEASEIAGVEIKHEALFLPQSGYVSPPKLCAAYAKDIPVETNVRLENLQDVQADAIILAAGPNTHEFEVAKHLPLQDIRGQITYVQHINDTDRPKCCVCYSGYVTPRIENQHTVGSTFQRWLDHDRILSEDDAYNLDKLRLVLPDLARDLKVVGQRASVRTASKDQFPVVGQLDDRIYISTAHGSHGILSALTAAHILTAMITKSEPPLPQDVLDKLNPARFGAG